MALKLRDLYIMESWARLATLPEGKLLINTVNAHSFNTAQRDSLFAEALSKGDVLIPDGAGIVWASRFLGIRPRLAERIAGWDLFEYEMGRLSMCVRVGDKLVRKEHASQQGSSELDSAFGLHEPSWGLIHKPRVMFMGSSQMVLDKIVEKAAEVYPTLDIVTYSPPYKPEFSDEDNRAIIDAINAANPDLLWIGMTAPKQEKWAYAHWDELNIHCHVGTIGAVFDFFAGTYKRAPRWWQKHSLEWLYRLVMEPKRMWRRYVIGNPLFVWNILKEMVSKDKHGMHESHR